MTNKLFTREEIDRLYQRFDVDEHEIRAGSAKMTDRGGWSRWFVYIRREAIQKRLDELFPGEWSFGFCNPQSPYQYGKDHVSCAMYIEIRGIRREFNGSVDGQDLNGEKGAATDAFKRVASMWGIGLYLQSSVELWAGNIKKKGQGGKEYTDNTLSKQEEKVAWGKFVAWFDNGTSDNSPSEPQEPARQEPKIVPPQDKAPDGGKEQVTEPTNMIVTKIGTGGKPYMTCEMMAFHTREPFRQLGYEKVVIEALALSGPHTLPDTISIVYSEEDTGYRKPLRIRRDSTGEVVVLAEKQEAA